MPTYVGFSTQNICQPRDITRPGVDGGIGGIVSEPRIGRKYKLFDTQLVLQDFLNSFNIKQGDKVGQPGYGTTLWTYVFEPNTSDVQQLIEREVRRVAGLDPRLTIGSLQVYSQDNGILIEMEIAVTPFNNVVQFGFFLNRFTGSVQQTNQ